MGWRGIEKGMADQAEKQRGGEGTIEYGGRERYALSGGGRPARPAARRHQQRRQDHEGCRMPRQAALRLAEVVDELPPRIDGLLPHLAKSRAANSPPQLGAPDRQLVSLQETP